jgi:hypothetical protein
MAYLMAERKFGDQIDRDVGAQPVRQSPAVTLRFLPSAVWRTLGLAALLLVVAHAGVLVALHFERPTVKGLVPLFDLERELNAPSFFSTLLLLTAAGVTAVIYVLEKRERTARYMMWAVLATGFLYMAFDEAFSVHDRYWGPFARSLFSGVKFSGFFQFAWVVIGIPLVAALGLLFAPFLRSLSTQVRRRFIVAAVVFLFGAIVVEMISAYWSVTVGSVVGYKLIAGVEETLEMGGIVLFIRAAMLHLADRYGSILLDFRGMDRPHH